MIRESKRRNELVHSSWFPLAQHVLCERISAVMQAHNSCCAAENINFPRADALNILFVNICVILL